MYYTSKSGTPFATQKEDTFAAKSKIVTTIWAKLCAYAHSHFFIFLFAKTHTHTHTVFQKFSFSYIFHPFLVHFDSKLASKKQFNCPNPNPFCCIWKIKTNCPRAAIHSKHNCLYGTFHTWQLNSTLRSIFKLVLPGILLNWNVLWSLNLCQK